MNVGIILRYLTKTNTANVPGIGVVFLQGDGSVIDVEQRMILPPDIGRAALYTVNEQALDAAVGGGGGSVDEATIRAAFGASETWTTVFDGDVALEWNEEEQAYMAQISTSVEFAEIVGKSVSFAFNGKSGVGMYDAQQDCIIASLEQEAIGLIPTSTGNRHYLICTESTNHVKIEYSVITQIDQRWIMPELLHFDIEDNEKLVHENGSAVTRAEWEDWLAKGVFPYVISAGDNGTKCQVVQMNATHARYINETGLIASFPAPME